MLGACAMMTQELQKDVNWMVENYDGERVATWMIKDFVENGEREKRHLHYVPEPM